MNPTIVDIENLSDEEVAALNKQLTRKLAKIVLIRVSVGVAVAVAATVITKKLDAKNVADAITAE